MDEKQALVVMNPGELAVSASAARAKAEIEAGYILALKKPRNLDDARQQILAACKRPRFAESAIYAKPIGNGSVRGPSIRFTELGIQAMTNIRVSSNVVFEDDTQRVVSIQVTDLESNLSYGKDAILQKVVERRNLRPGQVAMGERTNSSGQKVYLVRATEEELATKVAAAESKVIRTCGLRLIPQDIIDEAMELCTETMRAGGPDPEAAKKKIADSFGQFGIRPSDLEKYLGHPLAQVTAHELDELRGMYAAIKDGEATWADYIATTAPDVAKATIDIDKIKAGAPEDHTDVRQPLGLSTEKPKPEPAPKSKPRKQATEAPTGDAEVEKFILTYFESLYVHHSVSEAGIAHARNIICGRYEVEDPVLVPADKLASLQKFCKTELLGELSDQGFIQR